MNLHDVKDEVKKKISANPKTTRNSLKYKLVVGALTTLMAVGSIAIMPQKVDAAKLVSKGKVFSTYNLDKKECKYWYDRHYNSNVILIGQAAIYTVGISKAPVLALPATVAGAGAFVNMIPMDRLEKGIEGNGLQVKVIKLYNKRNGDIQVFLWDVENL